MFAHTTENSTETACSRPIFVTRAPAGRAMIARMGHATVLVLLLAMLPAAEGGDESCAIASLRERYETRSFLGYACTGDCESHNKGFAWAERHGIADTAACALDESDAVDGCRAYAASAVTPERAGYDWALENELTSACDCLGAGPGFEAGCRAYVAAISP